jgi:hypothetical protein
VQEDNIAGQRTCVHIYQELCKIGTIRTFHWSFM